jgi:hypothetical protein
VVSDVQQTGKAVFTTVPDGGNVLFSGHISVLSPSNVLHHIPIKDRPLESAY